METNNFTRVLIFLIYYQINLNRKLGGKFIPIFDGKNYSLNHFFFIFCSLWLLSDSIYKHILYSEAAIPLWLRSMFYVFDMRHFSLSLSLSLCFLPLHLFRKSYLITLNVEAYRCFFNTTFKRRSMSLLL